MGRSVDDARAAQRAASDKPLRSPAVPLATAKVTTSDSAPATQIPAATPAPSVVIGGITYYPAVTPTPSMACIAISQTGDSGNLTDSLDNTNPYSFHSYLALGGPLVASVDWKTHLVTSDVSDAMTSPVLSSHARALVSRPLECPFILDSGASHHISPERSDFKCLRPIAPHPIQGFNSTSTSTIGIGDINLCIASGHKLLLKDVLFVLSCSMHLVSVSALT